MCSSINAVNETSCLYGIFRGRTETASKNFTIINGSKNKYKTTIHFTQYTSLEES